MLHSGTTIFSIQSNRNKNDEETLLRQTLKFEGDEGTELNVCRVSLDIGGGN